MIAIKVGCALDGEWRVSELRVGRASISAVAGVSRSCIELQRPSSSVEGSYLQTPNPTLEALNRD